MIKRSKIVCHCGHKETRVFIGKKEDFLPWKGVSEGDLCRKCDPFRSIREFWTSDLTGVEFISWVVLGCCIIAALYANGAIL